jgi:hypothetical protein
VREYELVNNSGVVKFNLVDVVEVCENAVALNPFIPASGFPHIVIPCIGGMQHMGSNNGTKSSVSIVTLTSSGFDHTLGFNSDGELRAYSGHTSAAALHDFHSIAIASNGTVYMLMGDYTVSQVDGFTFRVYQTTMSHLLSNAATGKPDPEDPDKKLPLTIFDDISPDLSSYIPEQTAATADFWALGICVGDDDNEYLIFARGTHGTPTDYVSYDGFNIVRVGNPWSSPFVKTITSAQLSGQPQALGFAFNSIAFSVPGGGITKMRVLRAAPPPPRASVSHVRGAELKPRREKAQVEEEEK